MNRARRYLHGVVLVGVLINILGMALPFVVAPTWYLEFFGLPGGGASIVWMRQAGILLFFISLLYLPGGYDPQRHPLSAQLGVVARMSIGLYWLYLVLVEQQPRSFVLFGVLDIAYALLHGVMLSLVPGARVGTLLARTQRA